MRRFLFVLALLSAGEALHSQSAPPTVRVLTYNIHHGEGVDGLIDLPRLASVVTGVHPDLVALQEVDQATQRVGGLNELSELARLTGMHSVFGKAMDFLGGEYGVAVLSRWPVVRSHNDPLPTVTDREPRTALTIEVNVGVHGPRIEFTCTHLDQGRDPENRLAQARSLNAQLVRDDGAATILAGDMNARPGSDVMTLFDEYWTNPLADDPVQPPPANERPRLRVDYVLARPTMGWHVIESRILDEAVASDHRPVLVVLEWAGR
ncbi:MAG TPA: endonuclease/exonuclease/phosphatase family protein [Vicinamibacterales bacterium]|nr:endonuclease/exonuclease/phosphatase family protein [Vicinamibacterales bacterium]